MSEINQESLIKLIDRLNQYPIGLPDAPEIREFFSIYLDQEEMELASIFPFKETTSGELAKKVNWDEGKVLEVLERLAEKGTVVDFQMRGKEESDHRYWLLTPSVIGFVEFSLMKLRTGVPFKRIAEILESYESNHLWKEVFASKTQISRAVVGMDIPVTSRVLPIHEVESIIRASGGGAIQDCYCRQKKAIIGKDCKVATHKETCFSLSGKGSSFLIRRGYARAVGVDEMVEKVRELGKLGLIHVTDNVRERPAFLCNCCGCCCGLLRGSLEKEVKHSVSPSPFIITADKEKCNGCSLCTKKCQASALTLEQKRVAVAEDKCLGCGQCIRFCKKGALTLVARKHAPKIPKNENTKFIKIAWEKERFWGMMWQILKQKLG
ncbi:MAG: 4Fe-4S binding protein [Oligoflexia bacterium]|nr:4Fe-4S binding protein [Oligoflexia bacterium]